jgi:hypothetical protein
MAKPLRCPAGHEWEPMPTPAVWPPYLRTTCPVCGKGQIGPYDPTVASVAAGVLLGAIGLVLVIAGVILICKAGLFDHGGDYVPGLKLLPLGLLSLLIPGVAFFGPNRGKQMVAVARGLKLLFIAKLTVASLRDVAPFRLLDPIIAPKVFGFAAAPRVRLAYNVMYGRFGDSNVIFFEYDFRTSAKNSVRTVAAVVFLHGAVGLPDFQFAPLISEADYVPDPSYGGVDLADPGAIAHHYKVWAADPAAVRAALRPELLQYLSREGRWCRESLGGQLLLYRRGALAPNKHPGLLADALQVRDLLLGKESATQ